MDRRFFFVHPENRCVLFLGEHIMWNSVAVDPVLSFVGIPCFENGKVILVCIFETNDLEIATIEFMHTDMVFRDLAWLKSKCCLTRTISLDQAKVWLYIHATLWGDPKLVITWTFWILRRCSTSAFVGANIPTTISKRTCPTVCKVHACARQISGLPHGASLYIALNDIGWWVVQCWVCHHRCITFWEINLRGKDPNKYLKYLKNEITNNQYCATCCHMKCF